MPGSRKPWTVPWADFSPLITQIKTDFLNPNQCRSAKFASGYLRDAPVAILILLRNGSDLGWAWYWTRMGANDHEW